MTKIIREWLVRTRTREVLGPFTQGELLEALRCQSFSIEDEMSVSAGTWISAQTLSQRELDEITRTSTRNQTITSATPTPANSQSELTPTSSLSPDDSALASEKTGPIEIAPPLELEKNQKLISSEISRPNSTGGQKQIPGRPSSLLTPLLTFLVLGTFLSGFFFLTAKAKRDTSQEHSRSGSAAKATEANSPFLAQINRLIEAGDSQTALRELSLYHEKSPKSDPDYLIPYASLLITEGESLSRAKKLLEQVLHSQSSPALKSRAHHWLGYLLLSQDEGDMGESHFLEALQLNPKDAAARFNLGRAYLKQEKFSQALDYLQLAELEMPSLWLIHIYKGWARVALGNMEEARSSFKTAIQASNERWMSYVYYSIFLLGLKEYDEAKLTLKTMLTYDPHYELHSPSPVGFFQGKVNYSEYLNAYNRVMERGTNEEREMGKIYINYLMNNSNTNGEWKRMENVAEKGGGLWPRVLALKMLLDHDGDPQALKQLIGLMPPSLDAFGSYAYALRGMGRERLNQITEAQADYQKALNLDAKSSVSLWVHANLLKKLHRKEDARQQMNSLLSYHPNYIPAIVLSHNF